VRNSYFLLTFTLLWAVSDLPAQNPYIHHYTTQDGLPSNTVYFIFQDSKKFIWFATDAGVSRYDGTTFTNYRKKDGLSSNEIIRIKEDSFGRIWFFHLNASIDFFYQNKICNSLTTPFLRSFGNKHPMLDFGQDKDQTINFYNRDNNIIVLDTENRVHKISMDRQQYFNFLKGFPSATGSTHFTRKVSADSYVILIDGGIIKYNTTIRKFSMVCDTFKIKRVFPAAGEGYYIATTRNNIYLVEREHILKSIRLPVELTRKLEFITRVISDQNGGTWVVTFSNGTFFISGKQVKQFDIKEGQSAVQDHENNVWISSMSEGVFKISPFLFQHEHYEVSQFKNQGILAMGAAVGGGIWMTSGRSVFLFMNKSPWELLLKNEKYTFNFIRQFNNGSLLVGEKSYHFELFAGIQTGKPNRHLHYNSLVEIKVPYKKFNINKNGSKVCSFAGSGAVIFNSGNLLKDTTRIEVHGRIYNTFYGSHDELVINAQKNYLCKDKTLLPYIQLSRFDNKIITDHLVLNDSTELFNIEGDSIYMFDGNTFFNLSDAFGTSVDFQVRNITYHEPALYLSSNRNVYKCTNPLDVFSKKGVNLQILDINFRNIHDMLVNNDSLYIASDDGLTVIPERLTGNITTHVPIPYIRSVLVNDQEQELAEQGVNVRGNTKIAFSFGCIKYSSAPVVYAYKLEGLDPAWTTATNGNVVYQHLFSGNYTFKLKVRKSTSEWSKEIEYPLHITASFWRHPLFFTSLVIILLAGIALFIIRRKNMQMRHRELDHHLVTLELNALQSMMNPHFIFNALGSIQNFLLQNKTGEAGLYLSQFARLIRQNMNAINAAMINLDEEFDRLSNYLDLERLRMEEKFDYKIDIDEGFDPEDIMIPSMIIQPFVENSIWHGISALDDKGFVSIQFSLQDEKSLTVIIRDNGIGIKKAQAFQAKSEKHLKLGMEMIRKRLELLGRKYSVKTRIEFSEANPGSENPGTVVVLVIPFSYVDSPH
jgi:hypothetical protein